MPALEHKQIEKIKESVTKTKRTGAYGFRNHGGTGNIAITVPPRIYGQFPPDARFIPEITDEGILYRLSH